MGKSTKKTPVASLVTPVKTNSRSAARRINFANDVGSKLVTTVEKLKAEKAVLIAKNNAKDHMIQHLFDAAVSESTADKPEEAVVREIFLRMMGKNQLVPEGGNMVDPEIDMAIGNFFKVGDFDIHSLLDEFQIWAATQAHVGIHFGGPPPGGAPLATGGPAVAAATAVAENGGGMEESKDDH